MTFKMLLTAAGLVLSTATATYAQTVMVPEHDGDGNRIQGQFTVVPDVPKALRGIFAGPHYGIIEHGRNGDAWQRGFDERLSQHD